jgi:flagellin
MRINTNVASLQAQEAAKNTARSQSSSLEKLGTGLAINKASDDGAGLAIADKLRTQASSVSQSISNANSASALVNIADKAMSEQSNILDIVKTKLIQAATDTTTADGREAIRKDIKNLLGQFDNIAAQTNYNGVTLLQDSATSTAKKGDLTFQVGEDSSYDITLVQTKASNTASLGGGDTTATSIATGESTRLKNNSAAITLTGATGNTVTIEGNVGAVTSSTSGTLTVTDADLIVKLDAIAAQAATGLNGSNGSYTLSAGAVVDFGDIELVGAVFAGVAEGASLSIADASDVDFNVKNDSLAAAVTVGGANLSGDLLSNLKGLAADGLTTAKANSFMETVDEALSQLNTNRSDFGSTQNQLESSIRNLETTFTNLKAAESVIRDVDYAKESASFNKQNIIAQAGTYAMSQANAMQQNVSRLLQ